MANKTHVWRTGTIKQVPPSCARLNCFKSLVNKVLLFGKGGGDAVSVFVGNPVFVVNN